MDDLKAFLLLFLLFVFGVSFESLCTKLCNPKNDKSPPFR